MNLEMVKEVLYEIAVMFFQKAAVIWAEQMNTKPPLPYITLKTSGINRTRFPIVEDDGSRYYPCSTIMEINLYTKGKSVTEGKNVTGNFMNTAASDLNDFFIFIESEEITELLAEKGMDISLKLPIRDLTGLENDSRYRYRAMAEADISFSLEADGLYGIGGMQDIPNSSGGGTREMAETETDMIKEADVDERKEEAVINNEK